ncbi:MAG: hypothetical protein V3V20_07290 [Algisphaera sp.]
MLYFRAVSSPADSPVIPAQAGIQRASLDSRLRVQIWVPACAGMTEGASAMTGKNP